MRGAPSSHGGGLLRGLAIPLVIAAAILFGLMPERAAAQSVPGAEVEAAFALPDVSPDEKMLVESDQLVYDYDDNTVAAVGNVRIYYAGYTLTAAKVTYDQGSGKLVATGNVKLVDPSGSAYYSDYFDITDDFRDGFVQSLRVESVQETHFAAESAERSGGNTTTFNNGTYTACAPCRDNPSKPPLWNVRATKIVVDHREHMVYFTDARLEFFGMPMAWLPYFAVPDPTVSRKTGWLSPGAGFETRLGAFVSAPYYWALAPNYDLTVTPTVFSRQGLLADVEWRQRLDNGSYTIRGAGIYQLDPNAFPVGSPGRTNLRGGIRTTGEFFINEDWTFGWDGTLSSDRAFTRNYSVLNSDKSETISTVHLTGIGSRNFFEARASYFQVLTNEDAGPQYDQQRQAFVAPVIDYHKVADHELLGGEVSFTTNIANVIRPKDDPFEVMPGLETFFHGAAGTTVRATQEVAWQSKFIGPLGQVITPFASLRGDAFFMGGQTTGPGTPSAQLPFGLTTDSTAYRVMPAVGVEWSWPILATTTSGTHIFEPVAQLIARPDEMGAGTLPNNDAQSLVFDVSNLFDRDKFSGFDRIEGGSRANLGVRYYGTFASGASLTGTFGQSIQLSGKNSFNPDVSDPVSNVGAVSGLETQFSDYVAGIALDTGLGPQFSARGRFDEKDFNLNRAELQATTALGPVTASANYLYLRSDPNSGVDSPASVVRAAASVQLAENWRAFGTITYDAAKSAIAGDSFGIAFDNECLTLSIAYSEAREGYADSSASRWLNFRLQLRTIGETSYSSNLSRL